MSTYKSIGDVKELLRVFNGGWAQVWDYAPSHGGSLAILLRHSGQKLGAILTCVSCERLELPSMWKPTAIDVDETVTSRTTVTVLRDVAAKVLVKCTRVVGTQVSLLPPLDWLKGKNMLGTMTE